MAHPTHTISPLRQRMIDDMGSVAFIDLYKLTVSIKRNYPARANA